MLNTVDLFDVSPTIEKGTKKQNVTFTFHRVNQEVRRECSPSHRDAVWSRAVAPVRTSSTLCVFEDYSKSLYLQPLPCLNVCVWVVRGVRRWIPSAGPFVSQAVRLAPLLITAVGPRRALICCRLSRVPLTVSYILGLFLMWCRCMVCQGYLLPHCLRWLRRENPDQ